MFVKCHLPYLCSNNTPTATPPGSPPTTHRIRNDNVFSRLTQSTSPAVARMDKWALWFFVFSICWICKRIEKTLIKNLHVDLCGGGNPIQRILFTILIIFTFTILLHMYIYGGAWLNILVVYAVSLSVTIIQQFQTCMIYHKHRVLKLW